MVVISEAPIERLSGCQGKPVSLAPGRVVVPSQAACC